MSIKQVCVRTTPVGYGNETTTLNELLATGYVVVMCNKVVFDVVDKIEVCGYEYILEKEVIDNADQT